MIKKMMTRFFLPLLLQEIVSPRVALQGIVLLGIFFLASLNISAQQISPASAPQPVKYVFLFIGDGVSLPQQQMAEEYSQKKNGRGLQINAMPYQAITTTHAANAFIADSAAAGTAIACGVKTNNGVLGLDADGKRAESIAELAKKNGRKVGIISSVTINHATPAAFYAHTASRSSEYEIGLAMIDSVFDYFGGGGVAGRDNRNAEGYRGHIYDLAREAGYSVLRTPEEIKALKPGAEKVMAFPTSGALPYAIDGNIEGLSLANFTQQAIELLDNPNGFFLMVEGGQIDWACHDNDAATAVLDILEFDRAVSVAFAFAAKNLRDTLIVVTGDHETGALTLKGPGTGDHVYLSLLSNQKASRGALATLTEKFVNDNKENATFEQFKPIITANTGLVFTTEGRWQAGNLNLTQNEMRDLENDFNTSKQAILEDQSGKDRVVRTMIRILNNKAGISWGSGGHTALPVITSAWGNQAERIIQGIRDNTDIAKQLKQVVRPFPANPPSRQLPLMLLDDNARRTGVVEKTIDRFAIKRVQNESNESISLTMHVVILRQDERRFNERFAACQQQIMDRLTSILHTSTPGELTEAGFTTIKERSKRAINDVLETPWVQEVLISDFKYEIH